MPQAADPRLARAFGARLRALREEKELTQERLAWECDLAKGYLSQVEAGKRSPSLRVLAALAARLAVAPADLLVTDVADPRMAMFEAARRRDPAGFRAAVRKLDLSRPPRGRR